MDNIFNWENIKKDSAEIMAMSISEGKDIPSTISELYDKLSANYSANEKRIPEYNTYRQKIRQILEIPRNSKNVKSALYQLAGAYDKMTLQMLADNITISNDVIADNSCWMFIRLKRHQDDHTLFNTHLHFLSHELKKKFAREIIFISFDTDTLVIMCTDSNARQKLISYFTSSKINADLVFKQKV